MERKYTLNFGQLVRNLYPPKKRAKGYVRRIVKFVARQLKVDESNVKIHPSLNELIWSQGANGIPRSISILVDFDEEENVAVVKPLLE